MPTLVSKAAFSLPADSAKAKALGRNKVEGHLQPAAPPRNLQEVRAAVSKSIASVTRKLARLERDYYGDKRTVHSDAEQYVPSVKALMRVLWILDLNKVSFAARDGGQAGCRQRLRIRNHRAVVIR